MTIKNIYGIILLLNMKKRIDKFMMKVFVSQPMETGKTDEDLKTRAEEVITSFVNKNNLSRDDVTLLDSIFDDYTDGNNGVYYLGRSLIVLSEADIAVFAKGWENRRGCKIEHLCCEEYGIPIEYEE